MTTPAAPEFSPIADAFAAAQAEAGLVEKARDEQQKAAQERAEDADYIRDTYARKGGALARKFGRSQGFTDAEIDTIIANVEAAKEGKKASVRKKKGEDGGGDGSKPPGDAPPSGEEGGERFRREKNPVKQLAPDCPVVPIGYVGTTFYFLNPHRQLIEMTKGSFGAEGIRLLFGERQDWLWVHFEKFNEKTGVQSGWKADRAAESLIQAAHRKGQFEPLEVQRGLGGWRTDDGKLVLHCGSKVLIDGEEHEPGFVGGYLYSAARASARPAARTGDEAGKRGERDTINELLSLFDQWNWLDGPGSTGDDDEIKKCFAADVDGSGHKLASLLVLGWLAAARCGGALRYRSLLWITGDAGTGKTTLQEALQGVQGGDLIKASDPTPAGIWQTLGLSSRPVMIDEAEPDARSRRMMDIIKLARQAATGGLVLRGSAGHTATQFMAQSAFLFSSIIVPPMLSQDISRFAILDLGPLGQRKGVKLDKVRLAHAGRVIQRRLVDNWHRWEETLEAYRLALAVEGHDPRGCDQYGTLLAMVDMMRHDEIADSDTIGMLAKALNFETMNDGSYRASNAEAMLNHIISTPLDVFRGGTRMTIGALVAIGAGLKKTDTNDTSGASPRGCQEALAAWGIFIDGFEAGSVSRTGSKARIVLSNQSKGLIRLFADSMWHGEPGAPGGWAQAMRRLPGAKKEASSRFGGRGWSVPVHVFLQSDMKE